MAYYLRKPLGKKPLSKPYFQASAYPSHVLLGAFPIIDRQPYSMGGSYLMPLYSRAVGQKLAWDDVVSLPPIGAPKYLRSMSDLMVILENTGRALQA